MQSFIVVASTVGATFALVVWLAKWADSALSSESKDRIKRALFPEKSPPRSRRTTAAFVSDYYNSIFSVVYDKRQSSLKFFLRSAAVTALFLCVFGTLVSIKFDGSIFNLKVFPDSYFLSAFAFIALILCTVGIDYISSMQTAFFISLIQKGQNIFQVIIIAASDLIVTSNLFTFMFPIALMSLSYMHHIADPNAILYLGTHSVNQYTKEYVSGRLADNDMKKKSLFATELRLIGSIQVSRRDDLARMGGGYFLFASSSLTASTPPTVIANAIIEKETGRASVFKDYAGGKAPRATLTKRWARSLREVAILYGAAFTAASAVRVNFWGVLQLDPSSVYIPEILDNLELRRLIETPRDHFLCLVGGAVVDVHRDVTNSEFENLKNCADWIYVHGNFVNFVELASSPSQGEVDSIVSISWLFLSSFGATVAIYATLLLFVLARWLIMFMDYFVRRGFFDTEKSIFHVLSVPVAIFASAVVGAISVIVQIL